MRAPSSQGGKRCPSRNSEWHSSMNSPGVSAQEVHRRRERADVELVGGGNQERILLTREQPGARRVETDECGERHLRRVGAHAMSREPSSTTANGPIASTAKSSRWGADGRMVSSKCASEIHPRGFHRCGTRRVVALGAECVAERVVPRDSARHAVVESDRRLHRRHRDRGVATSSLPIEWRLFVITGFCGGLTTFSTRSLPSS